MNVIELIRRVESQGGSLRGEGQDLKVTAPTPLPDHLLAEVRACKPAVMIALGASMDITVAGILRDIRPYLPPALKQLPDDRLLALVNWHIIAAWETAIRKAGHR